MHSLCMDLVNRLVPSLGTQGVHGQRGPWGPRFGLRERMFNHHPSTVAVVTALLAYPGVDPTARNIFAPRASLNRGHDDVVLRADPRMAQFAGMVAKAPAAPAEVALGAPVW